MKQTNMLIVTISDRQNISKENIWVMPEDVYVSDILSVGSTRIDLINKALVNNRQLSDVLIIAEGQNIDSENIKRMLQVLHFSERHGAVVSLNMHSQGISQLTKEQFDKTSKYLSDYRVIPQIESLPVLIKIEMFERFGVLDEEFESIIGALTEFSLRFNQYGWSTVRANCWNDSKMYIEKHDRDIIQKKYPYIQKIEEMYYVHEEKATEHFADKLVCEKYQKPTLLFSLYEVSSVYNGTTYCALKILTAFWDSYHEKYEISILVKKSVDEFHKLSEKYSRVFYPETIRQHTFHLGYVGSQILSAEHINIINRCCLKYCICMLDIICLRSHYLCKNDIDRFDLFRDAIEYSNLMLSISRFSHDDIISFFCDEVQNAHIKTGFIYLGTDQKIFGEKPNEVLGPYDVGDYFIVIGNPYKHKMIESVLEIIKDIRENFIIVGTKTEGYFHKSKHIYGYVSGWIDNNNLNEMIAGAKGIIFPSVYEGFGLTLYDAVIYQKDIIVSDTQVNIELKQQLKEYGNRVITYRRPEELKTILTEKAFERSGEERTVRIRNWKEVAQDLELWIETMQEEDVDVIRLEQRWKYLKHYQNKYNNSVAKKNNERWEKFTKECIIRFPRIYKLYRKIVLAVDKEHYGNC